MPRSASVDRLHGDVTTSPLTRVGFKFAAPSVDHRGMSTLQYPPAGWYHDGHTQGALRWFDGADWTERTAPDPATQVAVLPAPPPRVAVVPTQRTPAGFTGAMTPPPPCSPRVHQQDRDARVGDDPTGGGPGPPRVTVVRLCRHDENPHAVLVGPRRGMLAEGPLRL